jgi:hypothetical protein
VGSLVTHSEPVRDLDALLRSLDPAVQPGTYAYCQAPAASDLSAAVAIVRESEGTTAIVPLDEAVRLGWKVEFRAAWITLGITSDLGAVGLTAAVATALAEAGIACNVVAGLRHDHLFVPEAEATRALGALATLSGSPAETRRR